MSFLNYWKTRRHLSIRRSALILIAITIPVLTAGTCSASLIVDGGFEAPGMTDVPSVTGGQILTGTTNGAWTANATRNTILVDGDFFGINVIGGVGVDPLGNDAFEGRQYVTFNGGEAGPGAALSQSFATLTGGIYEVRFSIASGVSSGVHQHQIIADATGAGPSLGSLTQAVTNNVWTTHSFSFIADSATTTLSFTDDLQAGGTGSDMFLDGVSVNAIPEPTTLIVWSLLTAIGTSFGWRRIRRAA